MRAENIKCKNCKTTTTPLWRKYKGKYYNCNACALYLRLHGVKRPKRLIETKPKRKSYGDIDVNIESKLCKRKKSNSLISKDKDNSTEIIKRRRNSKNRFNFKNGFYNSELILINKQSVKKYFKNNKSVSRAEKEVIEILALLFRENFINK